MSYDLGAVAPFVADVANTVGPALGITTIYGWRAVAGDMEGHPAGRALDLQVGGDVAKGDKVAAYFVANGQQLLVKQVIWQQRSWKPGAGWADMAFKTGDKPGYDPNHRRHVHVSFTAAVDDGHRLGAPTTEGPDSLPWWAAPFAPGLAAANWVANALGGGIVGSAIDAVTAPADMLRQLLSRATWLRVGQVIGGAALIGAGIWIIVASSKSGQDALAVAGTAAKIAVTKKP